MTKRAREINFECSSAVICSLITWVLLDGKVKNKFSAEQSKEWKTHLVLAVLFETSLISFCWHTLKSMRFDCIFLRWNVWIYFWRPFFQSDFSYASTNDFLCFPECLVWRGANQGGGGENADTIQLMGKWSLTLLKCTVLLPVWCLTSAIIHLNKHYLLSNSIADMLDKYVNVMSPLIYK